MLLALTSAVFLGPESLGSRGYILLSQIWDFLFLASYDSHDHGGGNPTPTPHELPPGLSLFDLKAPIWVMYYLHNLEAYP
jgi:hypothetical protein